MTNSELVQRWFENLWNRGIESTIDEILAPDAVVHGLGEADIQGRAGFHEFYRVFRAAFPAVTVTVEQVLESGDYATCRAHVEVMSADGRGPFSFDGSCVVRIPDGLVEEGWNYFDFLTLLTEMGAVPRDAMATALAAAPAPAAAAVPAPA